MPELTQEYVRSLFDYRDGELYWKVRKGLKIHVGDLAGVVHHSGYQVIGINGKQYLAHRLIFLYHHEYLPEYLDHIDSNPLNNDINNLREATRSQNGMNTKKSKSYNGKLTSSEFKGVTWHKRDKKWQATIMINGESKHLGYFESEIDAALAYDQGAIKYHGEFAVTNAMLFPEIFKCLQPKGL